MGGEDLAELLFERALPHLSDIMVRSGSHPTPRGVPPYSLKGRWSPSDLNPCFRICRYSPGGFFRAHHDGGFDISKQHRSIKTFMLYLNDGFQGGPTRFYTEAQPHYS